MQVATRAPVDEVSAVEEAMVQRVAVGNVCVVLQGAVRSEHMRKPVRPVFWRGGSERAIYHWGGQGRSPYLHVALMGVFSRKTTPHLTLGTIVMGGQLDSYRIKKKLLHCTETW